MERLLFLVCLPPVLLFLYEVIRSYPSTEHLSHTELVQNHSQGSYQLAKPTFTWIMEMDPKLMAVVGATVTTLSPRTTLYKVLKMFIWLGRTLSQYFWVMLRSTYRLMTTLLCLIYHHVLSTILVSVLQRSILILMALYVLRESARQVLLLGDSSLQTILECWSILVQHIQVIVARLTWLALILLLLCTFPEVRGTLQCLLTMLRRGLSGLRTAMLWLQLFRQRRRSGSDLTTTGTERLTPDRPSQPESLQEIRPTTRSGWEPNIITSMPMRCQSSSEHPTAMERIYRFRAKPLGALMMMRRGTESMNAPRTIF
uniref:Uncharacterized protein n=1 Tax=Riboviria sp. TaxID=2585031 RepID=A0A8K1U2C0_9VIRU|nr:MAG: hypothetical protein 2 [Riboviria sp.]